MYKNLNSIKILLVEKLTNTINIDVANNSIELLNGNAKYINKYQSSTMLIICRRLISISTNYTSKHFSIMIIFYMAISVIIT